MNQHQHNHYNLKPLSFDSKVKGFSLYVESEDTYEAIYALENALSLLRSGDKAFKRSGTKIGIVCAKYTYPYRFHCGAFDSKGNEED